MENWYVVRVLFAQGKKLAAELTARGYNVYFPSRFTIEKDAAGVKKVVEKPLLPSVLFLRADLRTFWDLCHEPLAYFSPYYNHFEINADGRNPYLTVDDRQMENFQKITATRNEHVLAFRKGACRFKSGDWVKVVSGEFAGVEGRVARIKGQTRVVVELEGVCMLATAYIPSSFLKKISPSKPE